MLDMALSSLAEVFTFKSLLFIFLGALLGLIFGILPGLGGPQVLALLMPLTFTMDSGQAIMLLISAAAATTFGGSITSILINTPGTPTNAATTFDGYQLTKQGRPGYAIGAAAMASTLGGIFGAIILTMLLPFGKNLVMLFSYPEYFMMAIMGLAMIAIIDKEHMGKAIIAGLFGLMLAFVGLDPVTGIERYTFGSYYLWDGIQLVPMIIGLFAVSEAVALFSQKGTIDDSGGNVKNSYKDVFDGFKSIFQNFKLFLKSSLIGTVIGIIPGVGGSVANYVAYGQAVSTEKNPENFGKGDIRGVIAPESSNNAKDGGALLPTLTFGIPGSLEMAVLLGALTLHGIQPGPRMLLENGNIALLLIYALVIGTVASTLIGVIAASQLTKVTLVKTTYIAPLILVLAMIGAYASNLMLADVVVAVIFGIIGFFMVRHNYSRIALVIALVLGDLMQRSFHQTIDSVGVIGFFTRPISMGLFVITILVLILPFIRRKRGVKNVSS
ncbi:tripartite tricarboxylate transporter permease [Lysinibacillus sp. BW-2-10]|uniref:tripartite tricarboxylate transporter permease n=1 Tax=Lysinibacillus sp. BW-2-10 TaxID=2590030 RepID=UPI00117D7F37|nr:tripartite tricarboxylate transporter permease [Lysinibacillus sp. BW-2-10]TSI09005.1 tripartite tricarboxylate transporter permease [Lysinibacillus sp. BW-2-10]